ncbi:MAG: Low conductance mechanosensitive channel YnaI, partial [Chlamydiae bacterium]|nr:Low conductance mechanosensitive channel YnaI [Chlamydiota bacterium]
MFEEFLTSCQIQLSFFVEIVIVILVTGLISYGFHRFFKSLGSSKKVHYLLRTLGDSLLRPCQWFIWGLSVIFILQLFIGHFSQLQGKFDLWKIRQLYFAIGFFWLILIWKDRITEHFLRRAERRDTVRDDKALIQALNRLATIFIVLVGVFVILDIFKVPLAAFVASGAVGGLAISLAAKDMISNFFGGLMIYTHRHFVVGDWIMSPNKNFEGVVESIGWYMTRIRTFERRPLFIPNAVITDAIIENPGRMYNRRIKKEIRVRYDDMEVVKTIIEDVKKMLSEHPAIDLNQTLMVDLINFEAYSVVISVYCFTKTTNWQQWRSEQQDVLLKIADIITNHGAEIAFPTNTVHLKTDS